jgi:hypothetical protein
MEACRILHLRRMSEIVESTSRAPGAHGRIRQRPQQQ